MSKKPASASLAHIIPGAKSNLAADYQMGELIGEGHFAKVKKAINKQTREPVAVKILPKSNIVEDPRQREALLSEIEIMKRIQHPCIISMKDIYEDDSKVYIIMELVTGGELFDRIVDRGAYSENHAALLFKSLVEGIKYLHERGIAHRDLKPENILYANETNESPVKISDFGLSKIVKQQEIMQTCCGTPGYVAPEVLSFTGYGPEVDMWSLGVILYIILCGFPPFYDENDAKLYQLIQAGRYEFISPYWDSISAEAKDLISHLLVVDPSRRFTADHALAHPWFRMQLSTAPLIAAHEKLSEARSKKRFKKVALAAMALNRMGLSPSASPPPTASPVPAPPPAPQAQPAPRR